MTDYYVRSTGGNDGGSGHDGTTFALGWATLQYAIDRVAAGDTLYICSTVANPFVLPAACDLDTQVGTQTAPIYYKGADLTTGAPYAGAGQAVITTDQTLSAGLFSMSTSTLCEYLYWYDIKFDGGGASRAASCFLWASAANNAGYNRFYNCRFTNCTSHGISTRHSTNTWHFYRCEIDNNSGSGFYSGTSTRGGLVALFTSFHDNGVNGFYINSPSSFNFCVFYDNVADGGNLGSIADTTRFINCGSYNNDGDGFDVNVAALDCVFVNCSADTNGGKGWNLNSIDSDNIFMVNCHTNGNSGGTDNPTGEIKAITGSPDFVNATSGSEDYGLQNASPLIGAGLAPPTGGERPICIGPMQLVESSRNTDPGESDVWYGSGTYKIANVTKTPTKRASSIANCEAGNIKSGVTIDDVAGSYAGGGGSVIVIED